MKYLFGVDIGGTNIKLGILSESGDALRTGSIPTGSEGAADVAARVCGWLRGHVDGDCAVRAAGVACAGLIDGESGMLYSSPNLEGWEEIDLAAIFSEALALPVFVENDVNAAAYGEYRKGAGRGTRCFACVTLGTGVGGGIVAGGKLLRGSRGFAGEIGHTVIQVDGPRCSCGKRGHVEAFVGSRAIVERAQRRLIGGPSGVVPDGGGLTVKDIHGAALRGNEAAIAVLAETGRYLGIALCNLIHLFDPEAIAIGGGVAGAGDFILEPARRAVAGHVMDERLAAVRIVPAELGNTASLIGAALLAAERHGHGAV